jgi:site-specific DNA-methyltransferase (adenine-specific)
MRFSQEGHVTGRHNHPTQKPPKLSEAIVRTSGVVGGRAFIPFIGSGTEAVECFNFGMDVYGCELDEDYYKAAMKRFELETSQIDMF